MSVWWRWMRDALSPTDDEVARLVDSGPEGWRELTHAATVPTELEIAHLVRPISDEMFASCRVATAPSDVEVNQLLVGLRDRERSQQRRLAWARPLVLAGAALSVVGLTLMPGPGPAQVTTLAASHWTEGQPVVLNTAITVDGSAEVQVTRTASAGTRVDLYDGAVWFEVDPQGEPELRDLLVVAGGVKVRVKGTRFRVARTAERISVRVARGKVEVATADQVLFLAAGDRYDTSSPEVGPGPLAQVRELAKELLPDTPAPQVRLPEPAELTGLQEPAESAASRLNLDPGTKVAAPAPADGEAIVASTPQQARTAQQHEFALDGIGGIAKNEWTVIQARIRKGDAQVIDALDRFLAKHSDTAYGDVARFERLVLLVERRPAPEALAELDRWLASYPVSSSRVSVHNLRAGVTLEALMDCNLAMSSLEIVSAEGVGTDAAAATAGLGACALEQGDNERAVEALELALTMDLPDAKQSQVREDLREARRRTRR